MTFFLSSGPEWLRARRRTIITTKYILAVVLSLHLTLWLGVIDYLSASFVALLTLQPNLYRGLRWSWEQLLTTTLGAGVTVVVLVISGGDLLEYWWMFQAAVAVGVTMYLCLRFNLGDATTIAVFTVVYLACLPQMIPDQGFWDMFHIRYATILIGIGTATLINYGSSLFRYQDRLLLNLRSIMVRYAAGLESLANVQLTDSEEKNLGRTLELFRRLFELIQDMEQDLKQLDREAHWKVSRVQVAQVADIRSQLLPLKNLAHHTWTLLLRLLHEPIDDRTMVELQESLSERKVVVDELIDCLEGGQGRPEFDLNRMVQPAPFEEEIGLLDQNLDQLQERIRSMVSPEKEETAQI